MQFTVTAGIALVLIGLQPATAQEINGLTPTESDQGWQLMFDGKSLEGWHSYQLDTISTKRWAIADSAIYRKEQGANGILAPNQFAYQDFEISIDWKIPDIGNSGIFLRYLETESSENIRTGPESQICGKLNPDYHAGMDSTSPGACYAMYPPKTPWIKAADQYNTFRVIMFNKRVAHFGNGLKLLEYEVGSADWVARYNASKYKFFPLYGDVHAGKLFLQDHGSPVWFRNIKIRPLSLDPWTDPDFSWPDQVSRLAWQSNMNLQSSALDLQGISGGITLELSDNLRRVIAVSNLRGRQMVANRGQGAWHWQGESGTYIVRGEVEGRPFSRMLTIP